MGEVFSHFIMSSSGTKDLYSKGLRGKDQASHKSIVPFKSANGNGLANDPVVIL